MALRSSARTPQRRTPALRTLSLAAAAVTAASLAAAPAASASASGHGHGHGPYTPGAPGINDPYFPLEGNGGYDVKHYGIAFSYDPATKRLDSTATITSRATQNLSKFDLDLQQLDVSSVTVNGRKADFTRNGQELVITPKHGVKKGKYFVTTVRYGGVPKTIVGSPVVFGSPYGFVHTDDGAFMGDEPDASSTWFPSNDHPSDKAAFTFKVTVPEGLSVMSNGRLLSQRTRHGKSTFVWDERTPISTYLATADIGKWIMKTGKTPGGVPMTIGVDPKLVGRDPNHPDPVKFFWDTTGEATDLWVKTYGEWPYDSTGAIADLATYNGDTIGFSLETATRPLYSDVRSTTTIAHELAHQYFGDAVSVRDWSNIWLNESFATWNHLWWNELHGGAKVYDQARTIYNTRPASWWNVEIGDPKHDTMFHDRVYNGGAMVLQFLREKVGDATFNKILRTWYAEHRNSTGTTDQFNATVNRVSGQNFDAFFDKWIHSTGKPPLD
jgi:aminopeptidase N